MNIQLTLEQAKKIKEVLDFYYQENHYDWEGCSCHGHYVILDKGKKASEALDIIEPLIPHRKEEWEISNDQFQCDQCLRELDFEFMIKDGERIICSDCDKENLLTTLS